MTDTLALSDDDLADDLSAWLEDALEDEVDDAEHAGELSLDPDFANRLLLRLRRLERAIERIDAQAAKEAARTEAWRAARVAVVTNEAGHLAERLEGWSRANHEATGAVTVKLSHGRAALRPPQPSFVCENPAAFWQWSHEEGRPEWAGYETVYKPGATLLRHHLVPGERIGPATNPRTGEPLPNVWEHHAHDPETGERVPHVRLRVADRKSFTYTTAK